MSGAGSTRPDDTVSLIIGSQAFQGWQEIHIERGVEQMPSSFDLLVTERYPGQMGEVAVWPGQECQVKIGGDLVITGYVDRYMPGISPRGHAVRVQGRGKCQDLVDCAAVIQGSQISNTSALDLAQKLAMPYGITVSAPDGPGASIPWFDVMLGETVFEIVERVTRYSGLLVYDGADGNLILARAGAGRMGSGFAMGPDGNVEAASVSFSMDQRFSEYLAFTMSVDAFSQYGVPLMPAARAEDPTVPRKRVKIIISEQMNHSMPIAQMRVDWEKARRYGRSQAVTLTCDSWRDRAGKLWEPNARATVRLPEMKIVDADWVIGRVSYLRGVAGTHADLTLMPVEAFTPQPQILQMFDSQVGRARRSAPGGGGEG